ARQESVSLTAVGLETAAAGLPEVQLLNVLREKGPTPVPELTKGDLLPAGVGGPALGTLKKSGVVKVDGGKAALAVDAGEQTEPDRLNGLLQRLQSAPDHTLPKTDFDDAEWSLLLSLQRKRSSSKGVLKTKVVDRHLTSIADPAQAAFLKDRLANWSGQVGQLTPEMLRDGSWKGKEFRRWNIGLTPAAPPVGRRHPYREYLDHVKQKLTSMGFVEMVGNLVETEFWNMDALYMPQFHPAREIQDVYMVENPSFATELHPEASANVAAAHRDGGGTGSTGWKYQFDLERTKQLILRSHGTALSARTLGSRPEVPSKFFSVARCFRCDTVDATHSADFFQIEGIVLGHDINFRHLLGLLRLFGYEVAKAESCRFVPAYFPFTEPSVEVHMKHPTLGYVELGGAGIFRPELTKSLGVDVPVIAWGLGIDRMAMVALGIDDIRDLFHADLSRLRAMRNL
ncbi:MAG: phenylalanine--tRNA ligase subunit alpha, partial [Planctomycetota bacterium]